MILFIFLHKCVENEKIIQMFTTKPCPLPNLRKKYGHSRDFKEVYFF